MTDTLGCEEAVSLKVGRVQGHPRGDAAGVDGTSGEGVKEPGVRP